MKTYSCTPGTNRGKDRSEMKALLQYQQDCPHMVTQVEWNTHDPISPEAGLFPDDIKLLSEPAPTPPPDPRRDSVWETIQQRSATLFAPPYKLPPCRFVNGSCNLKPGCSVPPRAGVGKLSQEEITYTRKLLTDYLNKGWIRPSYSRTSLQIFLVVKQNGSLRSVVDYRALNKVFETQCFPPPEWRNMVNQPGDAGIFSTFDCADFFFQNRLRDQDSWMTAFSTCFDQFKWRICPQGLASSPAVAQRLFSGIVQSVPCVNADMTKHPTARRNLLADNAAVFLDDALIHGGTFEDHLVSIYSFMYAMEEQQLHLSAPKTQFVMSQCSY